MFPVEKIHIMTDSCSDIPRPLAEKLGIEVMGIEIDAGGRRITEYYDITPEEYWDLLDSLPDVPSTAQITPVRFLERFEAAYADGATHLIAVTINSNGSGTYNACLVAKGLFEEEHPGAMEIVVLDGEGYSVVYGRAVVEAARMRRAGRSFEEIVAAARHILKRSEALFLVYSLRHLKKSGRINGAAAFVGEALGIRPILRVAAGGIDIIKKVRGERNAAPEMIRQVRTLAVEPQKQTLVIMYTKVPPEEIDRVEALVREVLRPRRIVRAPLGPCVSTNTGTKAVGIGFLGREH